MVITSLGREAWRLMYEDERLLLPSYGEDGEGHSVDKSTKVPRTLDVEKSPRRSPLAESGRGVTKRAQSCNILDQEQHPLLSPVHRFHSSAT